MDKAPDDEYEMLCTRCGRVTNLSSAFCPGCGAALKEDVVSAQPHAPAANVAASGSRHQSLVLTKPKPDEFRGGCVIAALVLILFYILINRTTGTDSSSPSAPSSAVDESERGTQAWICAQDAIKEKLVSPGSASFPWEPDSEGKNLAGDYRIVTYVDSQNSFGALLRTRWAVVVSPDGDKFKVKSVSSIDAN